MGNGDANQVEKVAAKVESTNGEDEQCWFYWWGRSRVGAKIREVDGSLTTKKMEMEGKKNNFSLIVHRR